MGNLPLNAKASLTAVQVERARTIIDNIPFIPQKLSLIGQYDPAKTAVVDYVPKQLFNASSFADQYGFGSMLHLMALKAFQELGTSGIPVFAHPVPEDGGATAAAGDIQVLGFATSSGIIPIRIADQVVEVVINNGDTNNDIAAKINTAVNGVLSFPVTSSVLTDTVTFTSKWKGATANQISVAAFINDTESNNAPQGMSLVITDMVGGAVNPDTTNVFVNMGSTWFTRLAFAFDDTANLNVLDAAGDERHDNTVNRTIVPIIGRIDAIIDDYITFVGALNSEWFNTVWMNSRSIGFELAASVAALTITRAQVEPARPYSSMVVRSIKSREITDVYNYTKKNELELAGGSMLVVNDAGNSQILDLNTTQKLDDMGQPLQNFEMRTLLWSNIQAKVFSIRNLLENPPFVGAVVIDDDLVTSQPFAISPKKLKAALVNLIDTVWIPNAWSKNRDELVASVVTEIDTLDPERLNAVLSDDQAVGLRLFDILYKYASSTNF